MMAHPVLEPDPPAIVEQDPEEFPIKRPVSASMR
jgi:hypothetical protein